MEHGEARHLEHLRGLMLLESSMRNGKIRHLERFFGTMQSPDSLLTSLLTFANTPSSLHSQMRRSCRGDWPIVSTTELRAVPSELMWPRAEV
jgi:hypothetical protein